jgi:lipopolysaccharide transport system ATP-binding protein
VNLIRLENINLHYSSLAFKETSFKTYIFKKLGLRSGPAAATADIHALKDISLEIKPGERVALIGHNGAGKSTLLKTIAGLYPISSGKKEIKGEVRSLFELNLGFELEATGRENILYRGLLLGQKRQEMKRAEEAIIHFADIGEFIDYPIKTYSAGMLVRLAFAISTTIPGDLLLLDEVIGAGDLSFMAKARARINELIHKAEIMLLASHDFGSVRALCNRAIVLHHGQMIYDGDVETAINNYHQAIQIES